MLTNRETEVHNLLLQGKSDREIARELFVALDTTHTYVGRVLKKMNVSNRVVLIAKEYLNDFSTADLKRFDDEQKQVIELIVTEGIGTDLIASRLGRSKTYVSRRLNQIFLKTDTNSRQELLLWLKDNL